MLKARARIVYKIETFIKKISKIHHELHIYLSYVISVINLSS